MMCLSLASPSVSTQLLYWSHNVPFRCWWENTYSFEQFLLRDQKLIGAETVKNRVRSGDDAATFHINVVFFSPRSF